ncbi:MAG TPA: DUF6064 family protein [Prolixibacteraceae bacterium]
MKMPFTNEQFFQLFERYNLAVFPVQILLILFALIPVSLILSNSRLKNKFIGGYLGLLWIWTGFVYHIGFFAEINKAAYLFGTIFILQGILIFVSTFIRERLIFAFNYKAIDYLAYFFILFGLFIYPLIGYFTGSVLVKTIALGLPCPSTIFTFGFLMLTNRQFPKYLLIIPTIWAVVGLSAAINFGVYQDYMMILTAIIADIYIIVRK